MVNYNNPNCNNIQEWKFDQITAEDKQTNKKQDVLLKLKAYWEFRVKKSIDVIVKREQPLYCYFCYYCKNNSNDNYLNCDIIIIHSAYSNLAAREKTKTHLQLQLCMRSVSAPRTDTLRFGRATVTERPKCCTLSSSTVLLQSS